MVIKVLDCATLGEGLSYESLEKLGDVSLYEYTEPFELVERISDADVVIINKIKMTKEVLSQCKSLKLICVFATGYDNIDVKYAKEAGIAVCNVPAYSTESVMLFTVSSVLSLVAHLEEYKSFVRSGEYTRQGKPNCLTPVFHEIKGMKWGIVGYGNIGKRVADVARALGAEVMINKRTKTDNEEITEIDTLIKECDIITLHCPLTDNTRGLISKERIALMKKNAILVNTARGAVTDESAIAEAIKEQRIGGFGTDVYSVEPFSEEHPFYEIMNYPNVCLTPHAAWGAHESRVRCLGVICDNISAFKSGKFLNRVDK